MPIMTIHCKVCGRGISGYDFAERMTKLRHHYQKKHPSEFRLWGKKAARTRQLSKWGD